MSFWYGLAAIVGLTAVTLLTRGSFFVLPASVELPGRVERALRFAPACALSAIIAPSIFAPTGTPRFDLGSPALWSVVVASVVFARRRSMLLMMGVGMAVFTMLRLV